MGCKGCPETTRHYDVDKNGNPIVKPPTEGHSHGEVPPLSSGAREAMALASSRTPPDKITYEQYISEREEFRAQSREIGEESIKEFSEDYKRIQIRELVAIINHEEVGRIAPTQAIVALWELIHTKEYLKVTKEFKGLLEQVDKKYTEIMSNKINVRWGR